MKAKPDEFVLLSPAPWREPDPHTLTDAFEEYWQESPTVSWSGDRGEFTFDGSAEGVRCAS